MSFLEWLGSSPPVSPPDAPISERGPSSDGVEESVLHPQDEDGDGIPDAIAGVCVALEYCDSVGEVSNRRVIVDRVYIQNDELYLCGLCLLRNARRTFRGDRILKLLLPPDWKEIPDPVGFLESYASPSMSPKTKRASKESWVAPTPHDVSYWERRYKVRSVANHGLRVLTFMARVDGSFDLNERTVLNSYVKNIAVVAGVKLNNDETKDIASEVEALFPTKRQVTNSLAVIRIYQEQSSIFLNSLKDLVRSDGVISSWEQNAMKMLIEILRKQATQY